MWTMWLFNQKCKQFEYPQTQCTHRWKRFKCDQCEFETAYKGGLKTHLLTLSCEGRKQCDQRDYSCSQKGNMQRHIRHKHIKERPNQCSQCDYSCVEKQTLRQHMRVHTNQVSKLWLFSFTKKQLETSFKDKDWVSKKWAKKSMSCLTLFDTNDRTLVK